MSLSESHNQLCEREYTLSIIDGILTAHVDAVGHNNVADSLLVFRHYIRRLHMQVEADLD